MQNKFSIYLKGFRKNHATQPTLLKMIETWKTKLNMGHKVGLIYMDLSEAFDSLNHKLLIVKLKYHGLDQNAVQFFRSYLSNLHHSCKINNTLGDRRRIISVAPEGSILDPILFNIFLNGVFFFLKDANLGNYADDSTLDGYNKNLKIVICNLRQEFSILSNWFYSTYMVLNPEKCHFMLFGVKDNKQFDLICNDITLKHSSHKINLGVNIDNKLFCDEHFINICKTANKNLNALSRINHYLKQNEKEILLPSFIISHLSYFPLIWMFCSTKSTKMINAVHQRFLRIIRSDCEPLYPLLLQEAHQIIFHQRCINFLMIELYKYLNGHSPDIMNDISKSRENMYNLRNFRIFQAENPCLLKYKLDATPDHASQLWQQVIIDIHEAASLALFKIALRLGNMKIILVDLPKYLFKMSGISD